MIDMTTIRMVTIALVPTPTCVRTKDESARQTVPQPTYARESHDRDRRPSPEPER